MGTRARIAVKHPNAEAYASIYTHWDGYPSHHGPILLNHYNTLDRVYALMALGDLSSLGGSLGSQHDFDNAPDGVCNAYARDRGETDVEARVSNSLEDLKALTQETGGEWLYLFDDGTWYCAEGGFAAFGLPATDAPGQLEKLADVLAAEAQGV
jgi:hypothetical protein